MADWKRIAEENEIGHPDTLAAYSRLKELRDERTRIADALPEWQTFRGGHFDEPNVFVHTRTNDRIIGGKKTLFAEEIQSDWGQKIFQGARARAESEGLQKGTKEFTDRVGALMSDPEFPKTLGIPDFPFKRSEDWGSVGLKGLIRDAAEGGYEQLAWTPGSVQNARYDLRSRRMILKCRKAATAYHDQCQKRCRGVWAC